MNASTLTGHPRTTPSTWAGSVRRIGSLARAEAVLLRRNPAALMSALAMPVAMVVLIGGSQPPGGAGGLGDGAAIVTLLTAFSLTSVVYLTPLTALVARREELVLKRLRTGELRDAEIIAGTAAPGVALAWGQIVIGVLVALTVVGLDTPTNPVLVLAAVIFGTAVFLLLAVVTTAITRTVEMAGVTTLPGVSVPLLLSGLLFPLDWLPEPLERFAQLMPLTPVVDLLRLGMTGTTPNGTAVNFAASFGPAVVPIVILAAWAVAGWWATRRWFRWEPRR